jgi:hypothetical protein
LVWQQGADVVAVAVSKLHFMVTGGFGGDESELEREREER